MAELPQPESTEDGFDTLYSTVYKQTYHSTRGALTEAEHVFLRGSGVEDRLTAGQATRVLEVGFGTGLNFFLTAHNGQMYGGAVQYVALEKYLLPLDLLTQLNHHALGRVRREFLTWRGRLPGMPETGAYRWRFGKFTQLELLLGEASTCEIPDLAYHAVYQDAFSPDANPELWTPQFFERLYGVLAPGGRLATYSVKGTVRRALQAVGFTVRKVPGPPGKREVLLALKA